MYIKSFSIENLKCFQGVHELDLTRPDGSFAGWTVVAGRNGSGKTSLLKTLAIHSKYEPIAEHKLYLSSTENILSYFAPSWVGLCKKSPMTIRHWMSIAPDAATMFSAAWGAHRYIGPYNPSDENLVKDKDIGPISHLFVQSPTLINALEWLQNLRFKELEGDKGAAQLLKTAINLANDGLLPDRVQISEVSSKGVWMTRIDGQKQLLQETASGYAMTTSLVFDLIRHLHNYFGVEGFEAAWNGTICSLPGIVLIDEIEAHLHISWQQKIGPWLCKHFPALQFIVTTHSPFICQSASPNGLIRLPSPGTDEKIRHVSAEVYKAVVHGDIGDAVMTELFGLEHAHSPATEDIYHRLGVLEAKLLKDEALNAKEQREWDALNAQLPQDMESAAERKLRGLVEVLDAKDRAGAAAGEQPKKSTRQNTKDSGAAKPRAKDRKG